MHATTQDLYVWHITKLPWLFSTMASGIVLQCQLWYHTHSLLLQQHVISAADVMKGTDTHRVTFICSCSPCHHLSEVVPPSKEHVISSIIKRSTRLDSHQVDMITCLHYFIFVFLCRSVVKSWMPSWKWWVITCTCTCCLFIKFQQVYSRYG